MDKNGNYKIKNVSVSTNGQNELYFDVEWEGNEHLFGKPIISNN